MIRRASFYIFELNKLPYVFIIFKNRTSKSDRPLSNSYRSLLQPTSCFSHNSSPQGEHDKASRIDR